MNVDHPEDPKDDEPEGEPEDLALEFEGGVDPAELGPPIDPEDPEDVVDVADAEDGDDLEEEDEDGDDSDDPEEAGSKKASKAAAKEEEEEVILFAKHPLPTAKALLKAMQWAFEGEEDIPPDYLERCAEHALLVQKGNRLMNLTKIVEPNEIAAKHYLDAWRTTRQLSLLGRSVLDIGTGGGYPAVPIALGEPNCVVTAIELDEAKAEFVRESTGSMKIPNLSVESGKAEEFLLRNRFDVVVMRALSSVRENVRLLRKVRHSLQDLVMMKGPSWSREVRAGEREAERLGFRLDTIVEHELPGELGARAILVYRAPGGQGR